ncbi:response regulator [Phyllobacterium bourgognense]|uniref:response regulator n=1 Tax=Phyllobacterium bourgognense TaxID=314236 RepID=UPI003CCB1D63
MIEKLQSNPTSQVYVVDDDVHMREAVLGMLRSLNISARASKLPLAFLENVPPGPGCIVLDVRMPGINGLDFQDELVVMQCS